MDNEFGAPLKLEPTGRRGATLRGSNGGPPVNISTESGQVVIRSASGVGRRIRRSKSRIPRNPVIPTVPPNRLSQCEQ